MTRKSPAGPPRLDAFDKGEVPEGMSQLLPTDTIHLDINDAELIKIDGNEDPPLLSANGPSDSATSANPHATVERRSIIVEDPGEDELDEKENLLKNESDGNGLQLKADIP